MCNMVASMQICRSDSSLLEPASRSIANTVRENIFGVDRFDRLNQADRLSSIFRLLRLLSLLCFSSLFVHLVIGCARK